MKKKFREKRAAFRAEFRKFIARGNIMDLAIGVIIGGAFGKIVTSLVNDIIMPLVTLALGKTSMSGLSVVLNGVPKYVTDSTTGAQVINPEAILWNYGNFLQTVLDFLIIALVVFVFVKTLVRIQKNSEKMIDRLEDRFRELQRERQSATGKDGSPAEPDADTKVEKPAEAASPETQVSAPAADVASAAQEEKGREERTEVLLAEIRDLLRNMQQPENRSESDRS